LVQMVKSANTNGLLDNDSDSSKCQNMWDKDFLKNSTFALETFNF
jgi:hypothetical protein